MEPRNDWNEILIVLLGTQGATLSNLKTWGKFNFIGEVPLKMKDSSSLISNLFDL